MKNSLKDLLKVFMFGKIPPSDFHELKDNVMHFSDEELNHEIRSVWSETEGYVSMDREIKAEVLTGIHRQIFTGTGQRLSSWTKIAAVILLPLLVSLGSYLYFSNKYQTIPEEFVVMAESGQKTKLLLPDGTSVWLNSNSKLSYLSDFNRNNRTVKLKGEAFFDVSKSADVRFTVETESINIVVHGTAFNVMAYQEDATINVSLLKGKVRLEYGSDHTFITELYPDQIASVSKENVEWTVLACDAEMESLWTQDKLKFENTHAVEVFRKLERWYGVKIHIENMNKEILYGFTLKSESLREILHEIDKITPITYKINGEEVNITYK
jgi:ferric-dicitrate binding protein FerR (iron transport regulator)